MTEPKMLTEAYLRASLMGAEVASDRIDRMVMDFRERGLIAPKPDKRAAAYQAYLNRLEPGCAGVDMRFTFYAGYDAAEFDAERPLTREMVREAFDKARERLGIDVGFIHRIHAALIAGIDGDEA